MELTLIVNSVQIEKVINGYIVYENPQSHRPENAFVYSQRKVFKNLKELTKYLKGNFDIEKTQSEPKQ